MCQERKCAILMALLSTAPQTPFPPGGWMNTVMKSSYHLKTLGIGIGHQNQGFQHARQTPYHWAIPLPHYALAFYS